MTQQLRFYSFVAGLYLSELQKGLQTAHAITEVHSDLLKLEESDDDLDYATSARVMYDEYVRNHKTIVILNALNSGGVVDVHTKLEPFAKKFGLPFTIFFEDMESLNGAPTATGIVVPEQFFATVPCALPADEYRSRPEYVKEDFIAYTYTDAAGTVHEYADGSDEAEFVKLLKGYRLA